ncbi:hypothetical protein P389DRAFT_171983 [Cystobasidium minutum MCA 4210]|uniref:uncharacterized protein n=1 Tax=Cystobasidium minutum MCA 4210 TaxID=1397322 RepID=UPI0034CD06F3|eukprot:jgi/Rhomi1/171983/fgenesh1_kg.4_\
MNLARLPTPGIAVAGVSLNVLSAVAAHSTPIKMLKRAEEDEDELEEEEEDEETEAEKKKRKQAEQRKKKKKEEENKKKKKKKKKKAEEEEYEDDEDILEEDTKKGGSSSTQAILIVVIVLLVLGIAGGAWWMWKRRSRRKEAERDRYAEKMGHGHHYTPHTVPLAAHVQHTYAPTMSHATHPPLTAPAASVYGGGVGTAVAPVGTYPGNYAASVYR